MLTIYHNPRCGKSREALHILEKSGQPFQIRFYLQEPLSKEELVALQAKLGLPAIQMVRVKEAVWKEKYASSCLTDEDILQAISESPVLLERAIVENEHGAVIARPPEKVFEMLR